jgi:hypothetical protein
VFVHQLIKHYLEEKEEEEKRAVPIKLTISLVADYLSFEEEGEKEEKAAYYMHLCLIATGLNLLKEMAVVDFDLELQHYSRKTMTMIVDLKKQRRRRKKKYLIMKTTPSLHELLLLILQLLFH